MVESLSATGNIISNDDMSLTAKATNVEVLEVPVSIGDTVKKGDVICILDSENLEKTLENAKASLAVKEQSSDSDVAVAERYLNESQTTGAIQVSRDFEDAQQYYDDYIEALEEVDKAKREFDTAKGEYDYRVSEYENYWNEHSGLDEFEFLQMTERGSFYKQNMSAAESEMLQKESTYKQKQDAADAALDKYNKLIRSYDDNVRNNSSNVMTKNDSVKSAKRNESVSTLNDELQIEQYEEQIESCTVTAPFDGVVTAINVSEGSIYTGAAIATVEDINSFRIQSEINEYDIAKVKIGQRVVFRTNSMGETEFEGVIEEIAPKATRQQTAQGSALTSVTYKVITRIVTPCDDFKMDMTAKMSIIIDEKDDVLTVPYDAVQTDENGEFYIEKAPEAAQPGMKVAPTQQQNEKNKISVTKGIESDYYIEVMGDEVKEGLEIIVPKNDGLNDFMKMLQEEGAMGGF